MKNVLMVSEEHVHHYSENENGQMEFIASFYGIVVTAYACGNAVYNVCPWNDNPDQFGVRDQVVIAQFHCNSTECYVMAGSHNINGCGKHYQGTATF